MLNYRHQKPEKSITINKIKGEMKMEKSQVSHNMSYAGDSLPKNNLRVWGVWDPVISRLEYLSESRGDCEKIIRLFDKARRCGCEIVRFDLSPLYRDSKNKVFK